MIADVLLGIAVGIGLLITLAACALVVWDVAAAKRAVAAPFRHERVPGTRGR
jgi:hypothetical protein